MSILGTFAVVVLLVDRSVLPVWLLDDLYTAITRATTHLTVIYCTFSFIAFIVRVGVEVSMAGLYVGRRVRSTSSPLTFFTTGSTFQIFNSY